VHFKVEESPQYNAGQVETQVEEYRYVEGLQDRQFVPV